MASSGNFPVLNPLYRGQRGTNANFYGIITQGNTRIHSRSSSDALQISTVENLKTGKWYWEWCLRDNQGDKLMHSGAADSRRDQWDYAAAAATYGAEQSIHFHTYFQIVEKNGSDTGVYSSSASSHSTNDVFGIALDTDNGKFYVHKNGTYYASGNPATGANPGATWTPASEYTDGFTPYFTASGGSDADGVLNFGQDSTFGGAISAGGNADGNGFGDFKYAPPTGFLAVCSANLSVSSDIDPSQTNTNFAQVQGPTILEYTGNSTDDRALNFDDPAMACDLIIVKEVGNANNWYWNDTCRGATQSFGTNHTSTEVTDTAELKTFTSTGWTHGTGGGGNNNSDTYCAWGWKCSGQTAQDKTYAVTVVDDGGNKYRFDGHGTSAITLDVNEGSTITFDQSDNTNDGHPLRIYTSSDKSGGEYTTGVTTTGTAGQAGAKTVITVAASAPTLYYQCSIHGGMGGQINTNALSAGIVQPQGIRNTHTAGTILSQVQKNTAAGFSICLYTGTGSNGTFEHGLTQAPEFMIIKERNGTNNWVAYHETQGATKRGNVNNGNAFSSSTTSFNSTAPTSSLVSLGTSAGTNNNGTNFIAYCWHGVEGYSKFGMYNANDDADGPFIYTGFRPKLLMHKMTVSGDGWGIHDSTRGNRVNIIDNLVFWNNSNAESSNSAYSVDFLANGFKIKTNNAQLNHTSYDPYIYAAWGDVPFKFNNTL